MAVIFAVVAHLHLLQFHARNACKIGIVDHNRLRFRTSVEIGFGRSFADTLNDGHKGLPDFVYRVDGKTVRDFTVT